MLLEREATNQEASISLLEIAAAVEAADEMQDLPRDTSLICQSGRHNDEAKTLTAAPATYQSGTVVVYWLLTVPSTY